MPDSKKPTDADAEWLFSLAREKSRQGRQALFQNVWDLFENKGGSFTNGERALMIDILKQLNSELEKTVRVTLSERVAKWDTAPHELVTMLAADDIDVAHPILLNSKVLHDADLVEIVHLRSMHHQLSVAMRADIGGDVCNALAETGNDDVILEMIRNDTASISDDLFAQLVDESKKKESYHGPLLSRRELPADLARKMYAWVSAALRQHIVENFDIDPEDLDDALSGTVDDLTGGPARDEQTNGEQDWDAAAKLIDKLFDAGQLTPGFILKSLREGHIAVFELGMSKLTGLRQTLARRILYEPGGEGLAIACKSIDVDRAVFLTIFELTRMSRANREPVDSVRVAELRELYDNMNKKTARLVLRNWLRNPNYLEAINQLQGNF